MWDDEKMVKFFTSLTFNWNFVISRERLSFTNWYQLIPVYYEVQCLLSFATLLNVLQIVLTGFLHWIQAGEPSFCSLFRYISLVFTGP